MPCKFIVLTGGPGGGKTAVMEAARQIFGKNVAILPEAASIVYSGGFPRYPTRASVHAAQRAIARVQEELERFTLEDRTAPIALCDRAIVDGAAYWPEGADAFYAALGMTAEQIFARYSTVIHLRTPTFSMGYSNHPNPMRLESAEQAAELDRRIEKVWGKHPNRLMVPATEAFTDKLEHVTAIIRAELLLGALPRADTAVNSTKSVELLL